MENNYNYTNQPANPQPNPAPQNNNFNATVNNLTEKGKVLAEKGKGLAEKGINIFKSNPKKYGILCGGILTGVIVFIVVISLVLGALFNNYKTPVKLMEKNRNSKSFSSYMDRSIDMLNGFCESEMKAILKVYKSSDDYKDDMEDAKDEFADQIEDMKDEYGSNYKYTYTITDKERLEKEDLKNFRDELRNAADSLEAQIDEADDYDSDDWEDIADDAGISKAQAKKLYNAMDDVRKVLKKAQVTDGYELEVTIALTGSELDEPEENEMTIRVYKVDGRWISSSAMSGISLF